MALWFNLMVNTERIAEVEIQRLFPTDGLPQPGQMCHYRWRIREPWESRKTGEVDYPYGDGIGLVQLILAEYQKVRST